MTDFEHSHERFQTLRASKQPFVVLLASKDNKYDSGQEAWGLSLESRNLGAQDILMVLGLFLRHVMRDMKLSFRDIVAAMFHVADTGMTEQEKLRQLRELEARWSTEERGESQEENP